MSIAYYDANAQAYFDATVNADVAALRARFLEHLTPGARILDAGCGSGRDLKAFAEGGYDAVGLDASAELAALARAYSGREVIVGTFESLTFTSAFDGIWACASLLHVHRDKLQDALSRCAAALRTGGVLYASLKHGAGTRTEGARTFTDVSESEMLALLADARFDLIDMWLTDDVRPGRADRWVNATARLSSRL
jgi:SAM-dependent methyltransferase